MWSSGAWARKASREQANRLPPKEQSQVAPLPASPDTPSEAALPAPSNEVPQLSAAPKTWRMVFVISASALCGGIAVVLCNRRLLTKIRDYRPDPAPPGGAFPEDDL